MDLLLARLGRFALGATLGGLVVGIAEGLFRDASPLYAGVLYAALWGLAGSATALALAVTLRHRIMLAPLTSLGMVLAISASAFVLVRFAIIRDFMHEAPASGTLGFAGGAAAAVLLGFVVRLVSRSLDDRLGSMGKAGRLWLAPLGAVVLFAVLALRGDDSLPKQIPEASDEYDSEGVILVVADALRADALGPYGAGPHRGKPATPHIDAFAQRAVVYSDASAQASWTKPAVASLLTSRHVSGHATMAKAAVLPESLPTVAGLLQAKHVYTAAVVSNYNLEAGYGFDRGFDVYRYLSPARYLGAPERANRIAAYNVYRLLRERVFKKQRRPEHFYRSAATINAVATHVLDYAALSDKFFLYVHYMEPHDPYFAEEGPSYARVSEPNPPLDAAEAMHRAYRDEVRRFDQAFGELLKAVANRGLQQSTTIILTADHGEEFGDHGGFYHGTTLYEEQISLPLLIGGPGIVPGEETRLARQIDIAPTIASRFGIDPPASWEGQNLLGTPGEIPYTIAEEDHQGNQLVSLRTTAGADSIKLIVANDGNPRGLPPKELFDLTQDPTEKAPLPLEPERLAALEAELAVGRQNARRHGADAEHRQMDAEAEAALRSLGYVQ